MAKTLDSEEELVDHYLMLCLPSGEEGSKLSLKEIDKAYRDQSRKRHPDKRPNDPDATADFQRLTTSYEVLRDVSSRATFDARLRSIRERAFRASLFDAKRRKLASDLEDRERAAASEPDPAELASRKEKMVAAELQKELAAFRSRKAKKATSTPVPSPSQEKAKENYGASVDEEKVLKVSWDRNGRDYGAVQLAELFERFGRVEDVVIRSKGTKKKGSAFVVMSSTDAAVAATQNMIGDISNPLLVLPLRASSSSSTSSTFPARHAEPSSPELNNIVGAGFQDYESSILKKLEKAKEKKRAP